MKIFHREGFSVGRVVVLVASLLVIVFAVWFVWHAERGSSREPSAEALVENSQPLDLQADDDHTYILETVFANAEASSTQSLTDLFVEAYGKHELIEDAPVSIPGTDGESLVFAAPSISGKKESLDCGLSAHRYCVIFRVGKDGVKPLVWGLKIAGFVGFESFLDTDHVRIATIWSLYNFSSLERHVLDLKTGEMTPSLIIEVDKSDTEVTMRASGYGDSLTLHIEGDRTSFAVNPKSIFLTTDDGTSLFQLASSTVARFSEMVGKTKEKIEALLILPKNEDAVEKKMHIQLYGTPFILDLQGKTLSENESE